MTLPIAGLVLAAGRGARFRAAGGGNKLLAVAPSGKPLVVAALDSLRAHCNALLATVPARDDMLKYLLDMQGARTIPVADPDRGMGHSLACGAARVPDGWGVIIMLGDMPFVSAKSVGQVAAALRAGAAIAAPVHAGQRGHPVGFSSVYLPELRALDGDRGAQSLLQREAAHLQTLPVDDPGVLADIDLPQGIR